MSREKMDMTLTAVFRVGARAPDEPQAAVCLRDARAAVYAADGYARSTGRAAVVIVEGLAGCLCALSGLAASWADRMPVLVVCRGLDGDEDREAVSSGARAVAGSVLHPSAPEDLAGLGPRVSRALAGEGPVVLLEPAGPKSTERGKHETASRALNELVGALDLSERPVAAGSPVWSVSGKGTERLLGSVRPVIVVGRGAALGTSPAAVAALARRWAAPVLLTASATTMPPDSIERWKEAFDGHPLVPAGPLHWLFLLRSADVVLALGAGLSEVDWFGLGMIRLNRGYTIQVTTRGGGEVRDRERTASGFRTPSHLRLTSLLVARVARRSRISEVVSSRTPRVADEVVVMDAAEFVGMLAARLSASERRKREPWLERAERRSVAWRRELERTPSRYVDRSHIEPALAGHLIADGAPDDAVFVSEGGACGMWLWRFLSLRPFVFPTQHGTLGVPIPMAAGVAAAHPGRQVWCVVGDGAFFYSAGELVALREAGVPAGIFVFNDGSWNAIRLAQTFLFGGRYVGTDLSTMDYAAIARGLGCRGVSARTPAELREATLFVKAEAGHGPPIVVDVRIPKDGVPFVGASMVTAELDNVAAGAALRSPLSAVKAALHGKLPASHARLVAAGLGLLSGRRAKEP